MSKIRQRLNGYLTLRNAILAPLGAVCVTACIAMARETFVVSPAQQRAIADLYQRDAQRAQAQQALAQELTLLRIELARLNGNVEALMRHFDVRLAGGRR